MYTKWFYIKEKTGNNVFSFEKRKNKSLFVPEIIILNISQLDKIQIQDDKTKIAFEDFDFDNKLSTNYWLKNFYRIPYLDKQIILFDNHNHAFYFWCEALKNWLIKQEATLYHIDEHADTRDNNKNISKQDIPDLQKVYDFTNLVLNVGDYIIPAQNSWLISKIIQIRNTVNLKEYLEKKDDSKEENIILNLDLDFFQPDLDFIDYELKKKVILDLAKKAKIITVATSPFFIDQELAIKVFRDLFWE